MSRTSPSVLLLMPLFLLSPVLATAQQPAGEAAAALPLPPPPGPYISSRPRLDIGALSQGRLERIPFMGELPVNPRHYLPLPGQVPPPLQWWQQGPMRR